LTPEEEVKVLLRDLKGRMGPSPYDIAWMARVPAGGGGSARWPDLIDWLIANQWLDGSWGGEIVYYHDRIICTLVAIIALKERAASREAEEAIERGERYIWHHLHRLRHDPFELVGFELILPTLLIEASDLGLDVPQHTCGYGRIRREKLSLIPPSLLYSPQVTVVHSLEFLGKEGDPERLRQAMAVNGSLGNSPATTSYFLLRGGNDDQAVAYLEDMLANNRHAVSLYPCRTYQLTWVLHSLSFYCESLITLVDGSLWERLLDNLGEKGVGLDPTFGIEDCDITSVTLRLLRQAGYQVDPTVLARFEDAEKRFFRTYEYERNASVGTNIHALEALSLFPEYPNRKESRNCVLAFLMANRVFDTYWVDKWHTSPYYATTHVLVGICRAAPELLDECHRTVEWLMHTQREDGSWGFFDRGTVEETAYAMIALLHYHRHRSRLVDSMVLEKGARFIYQMCEGSESETWYPRLYIEKCLYTPQDIVHATVLASIILYAKDFRWPPE
jgi:halimadienyl-diphosphate synthase